MGEAAKITELHTSENTLTERARVYIKDNKIRISELANLVGYSRSTFNMFLTGKNSSPAIAAKLEEFLNSADAGLNVVPDGADAAERNAEAVAYGETSDGAADETAERPLVFPTAEDSATDALSTTPEAGGTTADKLSTTPEAGGTTADKLSTTPEAGGTAEAGTGESSAAESRIPAADGSAAQTREPGLKAGENDARMRIEAIVNEKPTEPKNAPGNARAKTAAAVTATPTADASRTASPGNEAPRKTPARRRRSGSAQKPEMFVTGDSRRIIGVCRACQEYNEMGIITGRSGFGKTYTLKEYATLPRVAYIECDVTMGTRDLLKELKRALGIPHRVYGTNHDHITSIVEFLSFNKGYLIIVDEADKLMSKNTQSKMHVLRAIFDKTAGDSDRAACGIVIAGEPKLEAQIKMYLEQYAKRTIFGAELKGLTEEEVLSYLSGYEIEDEAIGELITRATNPRTGCFRLLDRTMRNVSRIPEENGGGTITQKVIEEAGGYMLL